MNDLLVTTASQVIANVHTVNSYVEGSDGLARFHNQKIRDGKNFVALKFSNRWLFSPSKFAGYVGNDKDHDLRLSERCGGRTDNAICAILGEKIIPSSQSYSEIDREFVEYCALHHIRPRRRTKQLRTYWMA